MGETMTLDNYRYMDILTTGRGRLIGSGERWYKRRKNKITMGFGVVLNQQEMGNYEGKMVGVPAPFGEVSIKVLIIDICQKKDLVRR